MTLVMDAGALVALDKGDSAMWERLKIARASGASLVSHGGVVGQAWRGRGPRQARLAMALQAIDIRPLDDALGRAAGALLATAGLADVIDAALVLLAQDGDTVLTSDPEDFEQLARAADRHVDIVRV